MRHKYPSQLQARRYQVTKWLVALPVLPVLLLVLALSYLGHFAEVVGGFLIRAVLDTTHLIWYDKDRPFREYKLTGEQIQSVNLAVIMRNYGSESATQMDTWMTEEQRRYLYDKLRRAHAENS